MWDSDSERSRTDKNAKDKYDALEAQDIEIVKRVKELADKKDVSMAQISLAWLLSKEYVAAPVLGVTKMYQLEDAVKALDVELSEEEVLYLEELYTAHKVVGAR